MAKKRIYDEPSVLSGYIWNNYQHLMTEFERKVNSVGLLLEKAEGYRSRSPKSKNSERIFENVNMISDMAINQALAGGLTDFRANVAQRILTERSGDVFINRCPRCTCIVRTPKAKLCTWCGCSWHLEDKKGELQ